MWIIKILFVISAIVTRAEVNGLLSELNDGYSYDRPEPVQAELAFYLNIPAGHDPTPYIARTEGHFNQRKAPSYAENHRHAFSYSNQHQIHEAVPQSVVENHGFSLNSIHYQFNEPPKQYISPTQTNNLPFIQQNSGFRPINPSRQQQQSLPFIQENSGLRPINQAQKQQNTGFHNQLSSQQQQHSNGPLQQYFQYRVQPRNPNQISQNTIKFHHQDKIAPHFQPQTQNSPFPSQELQPPPSLNKLSPSTISTNQPTPNRGYSASVSTSSYNAPLPFAFGVVPLKFDPLPLKTHLRQEKLLPITSYEAKVFHRK